VEAGAVTAGGGRPGIGRLPLASRLPDQVLKWGLTGIAIAILILIAYFFGRLIDQAQPVLSHQGVGSFVFKNDWDVSRDIYGALPLIVGTLITSATALILGVPVAVGTALFLTELCPRRLRSPLTITVELLASRS